MPYIITTNDAGEGEEFDGLACERCGIHPAAVCECSTTRRAVATLGSVRLDVVKLIDKFGGEGPHSFYDAAVSIPESGGTIGPLPDGTVIEVERVMLDPAFFKDAGLSRLDTPHMTDAQIIDAYNAAQEATA